MLPGQQREGVVYYPPDKAASQIQRERSVLEFLILGHTQQRVFGFGWRELPFEPARHAQKRQLNALIEQRRQGRCRDMHIAEDKNGIDLKTFDLQQFLVVFLDQDSLASLAEHGALFGKVKIGHSA